MPTLSAACLAVGLTIQLWAFTAIRDYWTKPGPLPTQPWPYRTRAGVASGLLTGLGLCTWLL